MNVQLTYIYTAAFCTIVILPADKGNATVVMDRKNYVKKMDDMFKDEAYGKLKKDPTKTVEAKVSKVLRRWEKDKHIRRKLPFLDVLVSRDRRHLRTSVYR